MIERRFRHDPAHLSWVERARCVGEDPELFFPMGAPRLVMVQTANAKAVCDGCPVQPECLEWSLVTAQDAGVWGGLDEDERREIRRQRRRKPTLAAVGG
jgi:WhiB family transcriptional regulator, redox-sensing transcriptional regulator